MDGLPTREQVSAAMQQKNWPKLLQMGQRLTRSDADDDGHFISAIAYRGMGQFENALKSFRKCAKAKSSRVDARIEAAELEQRLGRQAAAVKAVKSTLPKIDSNPHYLNKAGSIFMRAGLYGLALAPLQQARDQSPGQLKFEIDLADCLGKNGDLKQAEKLLTGLVQKLPKHQRLHYDLAKVRRATDRTHVDMLERLIGPDSDQDRENIFALFSLGKELEDLSHWSESFKYYKRGNDAAGAIAKMQGYDLQTDIKALEATVKSFTSQAIEPAGKGIRPNAVPVFIMGLPRSGTTLLEKIVTGHPDIESIDETYFLENAAKSFCGLSPREILRAEHIEMLASAPGSARIIQTYLDQVDYRRSGRSMFIEKYPMNFIFAGLICRHLPQAKILYMRRNALDVCFALYKQPHFRYSFDLEGLADYYAAYLKLEQHWAGIAGERIHFVDYEDLVAAPQQTVKPIMAYLGKAFSADLLDFHKRKEPSASASSAQIREKIYTRSVEKWRNWENDLTPLVNRLRDHGLV
ncbi:MAG: tetratricopeptide repeat protein [Hellea sp.]|nr:tetratricopeptide repeat protein [Hellea sp.]